MVLVLAGPAKATQVLAGLCRRGFRHQALLGQAVVRAKMNAERFVKQIQDSVVGLVGQTTASRGNQKEVFVKTNRRLALSHKAHLRIIPVKEARQLPNSFNSNTKRSFRISSNRNMMRYGDHTSRQTLINISNNINRHSLLRTGYRRQHRNHNLTYVLFLVAF